MLPENLGHLFDASLQLEPTAPAVFEEEDVVVLSRSA